MAETFRRCCFEELIQSDLFTFYVGTEKKPIVVHSCAVAATSGQLRALVNGDMIEAKTRTADIQDIEPPDFMRFVEFAYRCDYTVPKWDYDSALPSKKKKKKGKKQSNYMEVSKTPEADEPEAPEAPAPEAPAPEPEESEVPDLPAEEAADPPPPPAEPYNRATLRDNLFERNYIGRRRAHESLLNGFQPESNVVARQDFTPVFLGHARLYTFADMRLVQPLRDLALYKLQKTLEKFSLYEQRVGDIVKLARYAYKNNSDRDPETGRLDDLRQLVVEYMAYQIDTIGKHEEFQALLEDGGEFVTDFFAIVRKYLL